MTPPSVDEGLQIFDPVRNRVVLLPLGSYSAPDDQWVLELDQSDCWRRISAGGTPPRFDLARAAAYDPRFDRILVLARDSHSPAYGPAPMTVWALSLAAPDQWHELAPLQTAPPDRSAFTLIYDSKRQCFVVFGGGRQPGYLLWNDAWRFSAGADQVTWEALAPSGDSISAYATAGAIYDAKRDRMVAFGGSKALPGGGSLSQSSDVLALDFSPAPRWTLHAGELYSPTAAYASACLYDSLSDRMIVFPRNWSNSGVRALSLDDLTSWTIYDTTGTEGPPVRGVYAARDVRRSRGIVLSPELQVREVSLTSRPGIQELDPGEDRARADRRLYLWPPRVPAFPNTRDGSLYVWGGFLSTDPAAAHVLWRFAPDETPHWSKRALEGEVPTCRMGVATAYDFRRDRWLMYGGYSETPGESAWPVEALWAFEASFPRWTRLSPTTATSGPGPRYSSAMAYDAFRDRLILFGGSVRAWGRANDTWSLPLAAPLQWQEIHPSSSLPHVRSGASAVWDPGADRVILFGGEWWTPSWPTEPRQQLLADAWSMDLEGAARWDSLGADPPNDFATTEHFACFNAGRGTMEVLGQTRLEFDPFRVNQTELFSLALGDMPDWFVPTVGTTASPGAARAPAFDPSRDRLFAFRGWDLENAWVLDGGDPTILMPLDLEPNDPDNVVPAHGTVDVALLGTPSFDAALIDPASVTLAGSSPRADNRSDRAAVRDVNRDGWPDRLLKFDADGLRLPPNARTIRLDARTRSGVAVIAYDRVQLRSTDRTPVALSGDPDNPMDQVRPLALECASPARGTARFRMSLPRTGLVVLEVFSVSGRRLLRQEVGSLDAGVHDLPPVSGSSLPAGVYLAQAWLGSEAVRTKFVVLP